MSLSGTEQEGSGGSIRRDVARREARPKGDLVRFVVDPGGVVRPDVAGRLPGRGVWVEARRDALEEARRKNLFARSVKRQVQVPEDLTASVEALLVRRFLDTLGLAKRASELVAGFDQVAAALRAGMAGLLVTAGDAAADGARRLRGLHRKGPSLLGFTRAELGAALGRDEAVHIFVREGRLADRLVEDARRLQGFRAMDLALENPIKESSEGTTLEHE